MNTEDKEGEFLDFAVNYNRLVKKAFTSPKNVVRVNAGNYLVVVNDELVEIDHPCDEALKEWRYKEANGKWYGDPCATLTQVKRELGL